MDLKNVVAISCRTNTGEMFEVPVREFFGLYPAQNNLGIGVVPKSDGKAFIASDVTEGANGQLTFKNYKSETSFTGIPVGILAFDANGRVVTVPFQQNQTPTKTTTQEDYSNSVQSTINKLPIWTDNNGGLGDSDITRDGESYSVGGTMPFWKWDVYQGSVNIAQSSVSDGFRLNGKLVVSYDPDSEELTIGNAVYTTTNIKFIKTDSVSWNASGGGSITDVAAATAGNYTLTKPAKDGTYALLSDITDTAWLLNGNALTAAKSIGSTTNFDVSVIRNSVSKVNFGATTTDFDATTYNLRNGGTDYVSIESGSAKFGSGVAGNPYSVQILTQGTSPIINRLAFGTDGTGYSFAFSKNQGGTVSDLVLLNDSGSITLDVNGGVNADNFYYLNGGAILGRSGNYTTFIDGNARSGVYLGNSTDPSNYYDNGTHYFRSRDAGTTYATLNSTGLGIGDSNPSTPLFVRKGAVGSNVAMILNEGYYGFRFMPQAGGSGTNNLLYVAGGESLSFGTDNVEKMRITSSGNVGIGTTSPSAKLHVSGSSFGYTATGTSSVRSALISNVNDAYGLHIGAAGDGNSWLQAGRADNTTTYNLILQHEGGNVGIGTTSPSELLHVNGTTRTTNLKITNGASVGYVWQCTNADGTGAWTTPLISERYIGEWAANSGSAPSGSPTTGDYWVVNTAGTYSGTTYASGDEIYWNGSAWLKRSNYLTLPTATSSILGGIKIGSNLAIDGSGVVTVSSSPILTTARTISATSDISWSVSFDGSANVTAAATLATVNSNVGTFRSVTVNAKGLVTAATNPTTLAGYGITDVYTKTEVYTQTESDGLFVHLVGDEEIDGIKEFYDEIKVKSNQVHLTSDFLNRGGSVASYGVLSNKLGAGGLILDVKSTGGLYFRADTTRKGLFDTNGLILSSSLGNSDVPTERLDVRGNIRYDTLLKPNNIAGTNGQFLGTSGTQDVWTTLTTSHISNLSSYTGFTNYFTETEIIAGYQPLDDTLTSLAALTVSTGILVQTTGDSQFVLRAITGTTDRVSVSNGNGGAGNPTIDIASTYVGQTSITTLGTVSTGTWNGTAIGYAYGGTGLTALGTAGQLLKVNSGATALEYFTLGISNVSGLQTALDGKQATLPSGTAGQFFVRDSTGALNFMDLKIKPIGLSSERIGVGNVDNFLGEQPFFLFKDKRYIQVSRITDSTKQLNIGLVKKSNNGFIEQLGGSLNITATGGLYMTDFASPNRPLSMLTIDSLGKLSVSSISGGGALQASLTTSHVGYGVNNVLSSSSNFTYLSDRYLHFTGASANVNIGATSSGTAGFLESVNGNLLLQARSTFGVVVDEGYFQVDALGGGGAKMVVVDNNGKFDTQTIPSGGGSVGTIDEVLTEGNVVYDKSISFENQLSYYFNFKDETGALWGSMAPVVDSADYISLASTAGHGIMIDSSESLLLLGGSISVGFSNTTDLISLHGMPFNFNENSQNGGSGANGSEWGSGFNQGAPVAGDRMLFFFDGTRWVPSHIHTYAGAGGKTYLTID